jgi:hypothetical protein
MTMTKILTITGATSTDQIEQAIPYLDMRAHAIEIRDMADGVLDDSETVLELHEAGDILVLYSPVFDYAYVNEQSVGVGDSLTIDNDEAGGVAGAVKQWRAG